MKLSYYCLNRQQPPRKKVSFVENSKSGVYYHYTSLDSLWKILGSESFRATQARFSNDNEEMLRGVENVKGVLEEIRKEKNIKLNKSTRQFVADLSFESLDNYIICFCKSDDKLSQWRAYCRDDGVSIGMAFDEITTEFYFSEKECSPIRGSLYPVIYMADKKKLSARHITSSTELKEIILSGIKSIQSNGQQPVRDAITQLIPLIKHGGFFEEEEHRLIVGTSDDPSRIKNLIEYNDNRKPFITLKFAPQIEKDDKRLVSGLQVYCNQILFNNIKSKISERILESHGITREQKEQLISDIVHIESKEKKIIIGLGECGDQKKVFDIIDKWNCDENKRQMSIWCNGHLPIRSITVAPSVDKDRTISLIKHMCKYRYFWMKYVKVKGSEIPYRSY